MALTSVAVLLLWIDGGDFGGDFLKDACVPQASALFLA